MGLFDWISGKSNKSANAENHIKKAGELADKYVSRSLHGNISATSWSMGEIDEIKEEIEKARELNSSNPEYHYLFACILQARLMGAEAENELKKLVAKHPKYAQAVGHLQHRDRWALPFEYSGWNENYTTLSDSIAPKKQYGCYLLPIRFGVRRIVSFFSWFPRDRVEPLLKSNQKAAIRTTYMKTPFCPVVGAYALIDTNPREPFTLENILRVDSYRREWRDCSRSGYWLIRMLAQQDFTFFVLADPQTEEVFYNKRIQFDKKTLTDLNVVVKQIMDIEQIETNDETPFIQAREYFGNNFPLDNITF